MDQLKLVLAEIKKYHFWVLCGIVVVVPLGLWFTSTGQLRRNTDARKGELKGEMDRVKQLETMQSPANEKTKQVIAEAHERLKDEVFAAWKYLYDEQAARNQWPRILGNEFRAHIGSLGEDGQIEEYDREVYWTFIRKHIPTLFLKEMGGLDVRMTQEERKWYQDRVADKKVPKTFQKKKPDADPNAKTDPNAPGAKTAPGQAAGSAKPTTIDEPTGIVDWNEADRRQMEQRFSWDRRPTSSQVRLAQEDLWVLEALVRIIKETNKNATSQYNAPVKTIYSLTIGQLAAVEMASSQDRVFRGYGMGMGYGSETGGGAGAAYGGAKGYGGYGGGSGGPALMPPGSGGRPAGYSPPPVAPKGGAMGGGDMGGAMVMPSAGLTGGYGRTGMPTTMPPGSTTMPGSTGDVTPGAAGGPTAPLSEDEQVAVGLKHGRYVDQFGQPLPYYVAPPFKQFKMMPVCMRLGIDQRELPRLLANCANSSMPVVVRRVAIRPEEGGQVDVSGSGSGPGGPASSEGMRSGYPGPTGGTPSSGGYGGYGGASRAGMGGSGGYRPTPGSSSDAVPGTQMIESSTDEMVVEIQGIIYIFNQPNKKDIGTETATAAGQPGPTAAAPGTTGPAPTGAAPAAAGPATPPAGPVAPPAGPGTPPAGPVGPSAAPTKT